MCRESRIAAVAMAAAIIFNSTAAVAASSTAPTASQAQVSWQTLSMLNSAGAIGLAGAAAQTGTAVPPPPPEVAPPPPPREQGNAFKAVPIPVIGLWLAMLAEDIYILTVDHHGHGIFPTPNSPT